MKQLLKKLSKQEKAIIRMLVITLIVATGILIVAEMFAGIGKYLPYATILMGIAIVAEAIVVFRFIKRG